MESQDKSYKIKLPSSHIVVNKEAIWRFIDKIARTGNTFSKEDLTESGFYTKSEDTIKRVLSYLKYLNIVEEKRETSLPKEGKAKTRQIFKITNEPEVQEMIYELKSSRLSEAKKHWRTFLASHELYLALKTGLFKDNAPKTYKDLEYFLKERPELKNKEPAYYQNGGKFIVDLLVDVGLIEKNDTGIQLSSGSWSETDEETKDKENTTGDYQSPQDIISAATHTDSEKYTVSIAGPGINNQIIVNDEMDLAIVEAILAKVKTKLFTTQKNEVHNSESSDIA